MIDWKDEASQILRASMKRRNISYKLLLRLLEQDGMHIGYDALRNKVSKGAFNAAFFMRCLYLMGVDQVLLDPPKEKAVKSQIEE